MNGTIPCLRCGRPLRAASAERARCGQYGRTCQRKVREAAVAAVLRDFTRAQADKARELVADGALVPSGHLGVWRSVSSDGERRYLTHPAACNCPAGLHDRRCYHVAAARILTATRRVAA